MSYCIRCNQERHSLRTDPMRCGICSAPFGYVRESGAQAAEMAPDEATGDLFATPAEPVREIVVNRESKNGRVLALLQRALVHPTPFAVKVEGKTHHVRYGWVPGPDLEVAGGRRYGARLRDLREKGALEYESKHLAGSVWIYRAVWISSAEQEAA